MVIETTQTNLFRFGQGGGGGVRKRLSLLLCNDNLNGSFCEIDNDTLRDISADGKLNKKYLFKNISKQFMNNNMWNLAFRDLLNKFEEHQLAQESIDTMSTELCKSIYSEMDKYLNAIPQKGQKLGSNCAYQNHIGMRN